MCKNVYFAGEGFLITDEFKFVLGVEENSPEDAESNRSEPMPVS